MTARSSWSLRNTRGHRPRLQLESQIDIGLLAGVTLWCAAILAAPIFSLHVVYDFFALICHQEPDRSWLLFGQPLPVCIRCSAIYFGFLFALILKRQPAVLWLKIALVLTLAEVSLEWFVMDSVTARTLTGLMLGAAAAPFVRVGVKEMLGAEQDAV